MPIGGLTCNAERVGDYGSPVAIFIGDGEFNFRPTADLDVAAVRHVRGHELRTRDVHCTHHALYLHAGRGIHRLQSTTGVWSLLRFTRSYIRAYTNVSNSDYFAVVSSSFCCANIAKSY